MRTHPLVWTHASGRQSLVLGATASHVEGMDPDAGRALLDRHEWQVGDLVMMHRTTLVGEELVA